MIYEDKIEAVETIKAKLNSNFEEVFLELDQVMDQILHIIKYKLISFLKINTELKPVSILKNLGSIIIYVLFGIGVYFFH